jgi:hypothetical protein
VEREVATAGVAADDHRSPTVRPRQCIVSMAFAASAVYIAEQASHASAGFTRERYGHLFQTIR